MPRDWLRRAIWKQKPTKVGAKQQAQEDQQVEEAVTNQEGSVVIDDASIAPTRQDAEKKLHSRHTDPLKGLLPRRYETDNEYNVEVIDPTYVRATKAFELERTVPPRLWWNQKGYWGPESQFKAFTYATKLEDNAQMEVYLRRAVIELLALHKTGLYAELAFKKWRVGGKKHLNQALSVGVDVVDGKAQLTGDVLAVVNSLQHAVEESEAPERMAINEARQVLKAWDSSWKSLVVDDSMKFLLRKRLYQLTGNLIPDAKAGAARTVKHLMTLVAKKAAPEKLADELKRRGDLKQLANVKVHKTKLGLIEKEVALGRWKIIRQELRKRDLPIIGRSVLPQNKERKWMRGEK
ncbi:hypothetical protein CDD81_6965 [Ophiocordyceps australis]|uniref:Large ribosomal subunit protein mL50 n=1 Tax=Ophiocordyceps australis TaxID=1399860 RepID=A0A2C5YG70_9HYPO|nr:hypothetical protein CDD81_6965 [Ophiocordyceps australis]